MPDSLVVQLTNNFRAALEARLREQVQEMARRWLTVEQALSAEIDALLADINKRREASEEITQARLYRLERMRRLLAQVQEQIALYNRYAEGVIDEGQWALAAQGLSEASEVLQLSLWELQAVGLTFERLGVEAIENIVALARAGGPLQTLLQAAYPAAAQGIIDELLYGLARGRNPRETARAIIGKGLAQGLDHILLVARDQQIRAYRQAAWQQYQHSGVVRAWRRLAARNLRTCPACLALDGTVHDTSDLMELHPQDRCVMEPIIVGFEPLPRMTGEEWFNSLPEAEQIEVMGREYHQAWKAGQFRFHDLATVGEHTIWGPTVRVTPLGKLVS